MKIEGDFSPFKDTRQDYYKTASSNEDNQQDDGLFYCSEPGWKMVFKLFSKLECHLDVGDHISEKTKEKRTVYNNLRLECAAKFQSLDIPIPQRFRLRYLVFKKGESKQKNVIWTVDGLFTILRQVHLASQQTLRIT